MLHLPLIHVTISSMTKGYFNALIDICFPRTCFFCRQNIQDGILCVSCQKQIKPLPPPFCRYCAKPLKTKAGNTCAACQRKKLHYDNLISCFAYDEPLKTIIHLLKYKDHDYLADFLSKRMAVHLKSIGFTSGGFDWIIPVPSHTVRIRERGYNQSLLLAKKLSTLLKIPLKHDIIFCKCNKPHQTRLRGDTRTENLKDNFAVGENMQDKKIVLIDDVFTTGATVNECAKALKDHGAGVISVITLAKTL